jgi:hypothetical protein
MIFVLIVLDLILAAIAYMMFVGVFVPILKKNATYAKLKAKERAEIDRQLDVKEYLGVKINNDEIIDIKVRK